MGACNIEFAARAQAAACIPPPRDLDRVRGMRRFGLCLVVALASHKAWAESPPVKVELRTSWAPPPYVVEVL